MVWDRQGHMLHINDRVEQPQRPELRHWWFLSIKGHIAACSNSFRLVNPWCKFLVIQYNWWQISLTTVIHNFIDLPHADSDQYAVDMVFYVFQFYQVASLHGGIGGWWGFTRIPVTRQHIKGGDPISVVPTPALPLVFSGCRPRTPPTPPVC